MPYRLLIFITGTDKTKYSPFLQPLEVVTGIPCTMAFRIKNLGKTFPGGIIKKVLISALLGMASFRQQSMVNIKIPKLENQEEFNFTIPPFVPRISGIMEISMKVEVEDKEKIEYFQTAREDHGPISDEKFFNYISVLERNLLDIVMLLQQSEKRGEEK